MTAMPIVSAAGYIPIPWRLAPMLFFLCYLTATVLLFAFGPWPYPLEDGSKLYLFLALAHLSFAAGYLLPALTRNPAPSRISYPPDRIAAWCIIVSSIMLYPTGVFQTGSNTWHAGSGTNLGTAYLMSLAARAESTSPVSWCRCMLAPILAASLPLSVFYWTRLRPWIKVLAVVNGVGGVAIYVCAGTNKAIADTVAIIPAVLLAAWLAGNIRLNYRWFAAGVIAVLILIAGVLLFFGQTQYERINTPARNGWMSPPGIAADHTWMGMDAAPQGVQIAVLGFTNYITQGYFAVYLSLDQPFVPTFGFGNSMFLTRQVARFTGMADVGDRSYPARLQTEGLWDATGMWSSIYPWLASDVSFPGTIIVVFFIGRMFALTWLDAIGGRNPFAVVLFSQLVIMLFYFCANNQCLQDAEPCIAFACVLGTWICSRVRRARETSGALRVASAAPQSA